MTDFQVTHKIRAWLHDWCDTAMGSSCYCKSIMNELNKLDITKVGY